MQYVDDTLLLLENKMESVKNLKWILSFFEQLCRMRINFNKCDLIPINIDPDEAQLFFTD
jgi:hypothetical protein